MNLPDTFDKIRGGIFHIECRNMVNERIGSGSGFFSCGFLITNFHVSQVPIDSKVWIRREGDTKFGEDGVTLLGGNFLNSRRSASDENNYDYAIIDIPELRNLPEIYNFTLKSSVDSRIGDPIAFAGFPFEHQNLTCHTGIISSFYTSGSVRVIQLDASVNASNSGGPLFNPATGDVIGIVTRKATGLTRAFGELRHVITNNIQTLQLSSSHGTVSISGIDPIEAIKFSHKHMLRLLGEIERQSNVGIGYAFSINHLLDDNIIFDVLNSDT
ncbi:S1 family peptidase [Rhizobium binxianense]